MHNYRTDCLSMLAETYSSSFLEGLSDEIECCGLRWHKNQLYLTQKSTPASSLVKYQTLLSDMRSFCEGKSDNNNAISIAIELIEI